MAVDGAARALDRGLFRAGAAYPFLRAPIEELPRVEDNDVHGIATDGAAVYYAPGSAPDAAAVAHMLIHCLFRHLIAPEDAVRPLWDLACDLSAEVLRAELFPSGEGNINRRIIADALPEGVDPRAAGAVYRALLDVFEEELSSLEGRFHRDDHRYWYTPPKSEAHVSAAGEPTHRERVAAALEAGWPSPDALGGGFALTGRFGLRPGSREERMLLREAGKYDFSRYLRRFSMEREELRLDLAGFDVIPYTYGLERYGNMPFIEPLEYAECRRVEELVIAIDTSGSCARPVVERFLSEIHRILMKGDSFFRRMNVHVIQCDAAVQSHAAIHSLEEWQDYTKRLTVKGRGGTDFTPVFRLVDKLRREGELTRLKGLLYFTDGDGVYPRKPPPYETAFVYTTRRALRQTRPEWVVPLCLEKLEFVGLTPREKG